ncbi:hypothetical protein [Rhodoferax sp.]|uniref:hypothetical protein n=1 Tax=Rhodoferax sp. TaxID=50421 RepID=UPI002ACD9236|nr:hypothetical protein [Rhodoferax sp.]MDZ7920739.1 hypothetical protein [Rhodoferax sp.]
MRALLIAGLVAAIAAGALALRSHFVRQGDIQGAARVQALWDAQVRVDQAESLRLQQQANADLLHKFRNAERIRDEDNQRALARTARERAAATRIGSLLDTIEALNRRDMSEAAANPGAAGIAQSATTARELFGSCAAAHSGLAAEADRLRDQVSGLQDFALNVCNKGHR